MSAVLNFSNDLPTIFLVQIAKTGEISMQILRREWNLPFTAILFEVEDGEDKFVCSITENGVDPENSHPQMNKNTSNFVIFLSHRGSTDMVFLDHLRVVAHSVRGGLHHEYCLVEKAA